MVNNILNVYTYLHDLDQISDFVYKTTQNDLLPILKEENNVHKRKLCLNIFIWVTIPLFASKNSTNTFIVDKSTRDARSFIWFRTAGQYNNSTVWIPGFGRRCSCQLHNYFTR